MDLIPRAAAIECAINAADDWDGGWNPNREEYIRKYFEDLPAVNAIPVNWISAYMNQAYGRVRAEIIREMLDVWMEQEAR